METITLEQIEALAEQLATEAATERARLMRLIRAEALAFPAAVDAAV